MEVCIVFPGEFSLCPFGHEIGQHLRLDSSERLVGYFKGKKLNGPFGYSFRGVPVVNDVI
jgi:hypothetical protein